MASTAKVYNKSFALCFSNGETRHIFLFPFWGGFSKTESMSSLRFLYFLGVLVTWTAFGQNSLVVEKFTTGTSSSVYVDLEGEKDVPCPSQMVQTVVKRAPGAVEIKVLSPGPSAAGPGRSCASLGKESALVILDQVTAGLRISLHPDSKGWRLVGYRPFK